MIKTCLTALLFLGSALFLYVRSQADTMALWYEYYKLNTPEKELEGFLDSVGRLSPHQWMQDITHTEDSLFYNQQHVNHIIHPADYKGIIDFFREQNDGYYFGNDYDWLRRVFKGYSPDTAGDALTYLCLYSFDKKRSDFNEYAISLNNLPYNNCDLYFFKYNRLVAIHHVYYKFNLNLNHFKDKDNKTVVYYTMNFGSGSGIWQFNNYFFKYSGEKLTPALDIFENCNLNSWGTPRSFWLETSVIGTKPLTLKFVYNVQLFDTAEIINDSAEVEFYYDTLNRSFTGKFDKAKFSWPQLLTYSLNCPELFFINIHYSLLRRSLSRENPVRRRVTLLYLERVRNNLADDYY